MKRIAIALSAALLAGCGANRSEMESREKALTDSIAVNGFISSQAAVENKKDTAHKFIRTADMKFKVKNVITSTMRIEQLAVQNEGFVTLSNLTQEVAYKENVALSADSTLQTTHYVSRCFITLRIPNTKLDTTLKQIAAEIYFLDYRLIKANDVALDLLQNKLTMKRAKTHEERLTKAIDEKGKKLGETYHAEEGLAGKQEKADEALVSNLRLQDEIDYSTVTLELYQAESLFREVMKDEKNIRAYEPSFFSKAADAIAGGWRAFMVLIVALLNAWVFILLAAVFLILYRRYLYRKG